MLLLDERRLTRDALRYGFAVGKLRVLETRMLDRAAYERLLDAPSFAEQKRLLSESAYGRYLEGAQTAEEVEEALDEALDAFYRYIDEAALPTAVVTFFRARYDFTNLKAALKAAVLDAPLDGLLVAHGSVAAEDFAGDLDSLPAHLASVAKALADETDPAKIDAAVDSAMYAELARLAKEAKSSYLARIAKLIVDVGNVKTLARGAHAGLTPESVRGLLAEGGTIPAAELSRLADVPTAELGAALKKYGSLAQLAALDLSEPAELDVAADAVMMHVLRDGRHGATGPEPVIAYVFAREVEAATLRTLLLGRLSNIPTETLRARLRASYR